MKKELKTAITKTANNLKQSLPVLVAVILLIAIIQVLIPSSFYSKIFTGNTLLDSTLTAIMGSISAGNPLNSYVLGGEFLKEGTSLQAVTAFILAWVTVGVVQLPAESLMLGKRFALVRNLLSFLSAILIAFLTVKTLSLCSI